MQAREPTSDPRPDKWLELRRELQRIPAKPSARAHPRNWLFRLKRAADFVGHARPGPARFFAHVNPYPKPFEHVRFQTDDGVTIAGWLGRQPKTPKPPFGLVIVPGMFSSKDDTIHKRRAIRIWRHWKIPVLPIDMRGFGESGGIATAGWKEAMDVHAAARFLAKETGVERVAILAESLGGAAALNAHAYDCESGRNLLAGGVLTYSAFLDARDAVDHISTPPPPGHPFRPQWMGFSRLLEMKSYGGYKRFDHYLEDAAKVNGLQNAEALYELANPKWKVSMMHHPTLCVHATDDPVVPVRHARRMERYARNYPHIQTLVTNWGAHTGFEGMEPWWFWEINARFYGAVNDVELPNLFDNVR